MNRGRCAHLCALVGAVLCAACGDGADDKESTSSEPVVRASAWTPTDEAADPFLAEKPADALCDPLGYAVEDFEQEQAFFVDTEACDYLTVEQPALANVAEGEFLHLRLYHYELTAAAPATARLAIAFGMHPVWEQSIDIPAEAELIDTTWQVERALRAGDRVLFHVGNHGDNNYALLELSKLP